jgi:transcriptional regulator with XRE-family HTH domain
MTGARLSDVGEVLRAARHKQNLSVSAVAAATRIKPAYLEALEDGDYSVLPGQAYVTGFLRNYAHFLGLPADDMVQEFYTYQPPPQPTVRPATRVLANGHQRQMRKRFFWMLGAVAVILAAAFAIKVYNDQYDHGYAAPLVTPQNSGGTITRPAAVVQHSPTGTIRLHLRAGSPVWVRITADGHRAFQGLLRRSGGTWIAHHSIYVMTYDGTRVSAVENGRALGVVSRQPGLGVWSLTATGWKRIS